MSNVYRKAIHNEKNEFMNEKQVPFLMTCLFLGFYFPTLSLSKNLEDVPPEPVLDYRYEVMMTAGVRTVVGTLNKTNDEQQKISTMAYSLTVQNGFLVGDHFEPFYELDYKRLSREIGDFSDTSSKIDWGVGAIFNVPVSKKGKLGLSGGNAPLFSKARWVPYGGFALSSVGNSEADRFGSETKIAEKELHTSLIVGTRYLFIRNLGLNFWLRLSYEKSSNEVTETSKTGGSLSKLIVTANLFSFTVLF